MNRFYLRNVLTLLCLIPVYCSYGQTDCGFDEIHKSLISTDSSYNKSITALSNRLKQLNEQRLLAPNSPLAIVYRIPVVVHVVHRGEAVGAGSNISDAQIQSAITSLSQFYRGTLGSSPDAEIEFRLASLDPSCGPTNGIIRVNGNGVTSYSTDGLITGGAGNEVAVKNLSRWNNTSYYNIWIVSEINNNNGGGGIQGFAYFPGAPGTVDGAVMLYNAFGYDPTNTLGYNLKTATDENKTAIHELGHAFSLYHSFEGDDANSDGVADQCPANVSCTADGDEICDTEPHRRSPSNCPAGANVCGGMLDNIVKNFMDYSSSACQDRFTAGQVTRMRDAIALYRPSLANSRGLNTASPVYPYTPPVGACGSPTGATGLSSDFAGIMNISINGRNFSSLTPRIDNASTGYLNWTTDCHSTNELVRGGTYSFSVSVYALNQEQVRAWIDYNNNGAFDNLTEQIYVNTSIPSHPSDYVTVSGMFTIPVTAVANTPLRLRVIEELSPIHGPVTIPSACYSSTYGQTEDFSLFLSSTLPVVLESFTGKLSGKNGILNWTSSSEQNAKEFLVEKSGDGAIFNSIGSVKADGKINAVKEYSFVDRSLMDGINYYRLRMVDKDGHFEFSKIVTLKSTNNRNSPVHLLSNPVGNNTIDLQFAEVGEGKVQVQLVDLTGKILVNWNGDKLANRRVTIDVSEKHLSTGIYILRTTIQGKQYSQKVVIK